MSIGGFKRQINEAQLDNFVLSVRRQVGKDTTDIITPEHVIFKQLEMKGAIGDAPPGMGPVEKLRYATPNRAVTLSRGNGMRAKIQVPHNSRTQADFDWIMRLGTLTIDEYTYKNTQGPEAMVNFLKEQMDDLEVARENQFVSWLWEGYTDADSHVFGLKDAIRFDPTADPTRGEIGYISVDDLEDEDGNPLWTNQSKNYAAPAIEFDSGAQIRTFLDDGTNCLLDLWVACTNNPDGQKSSGKPDLIACNQPYYRLCHKLVKQGLMFRDDQKAYHLGCDGFDYKGATLFFDRDCPNDPNNSGYGVAFLLNTSKMRWKWATGIKNDWGAMYKHSEQTAYCWDETTQFTITYKDLGSFGVHYGVQPPEVI